MINVDLLIRRRQERQQARQVEARDRAEIGLRLARIEKRVERLEQQVGVQPVDDGSQEVDDESEDEPLA